MPTDFELTVHRDSGGGKPTLRLGRCCGTSVGTSTDRPITAVILGHTGQESTARQLAESYVEANRDLAANADVDAAVVFLDVGAAVATVVMPAIGRTQVYWRRVGTLFALSSRPGGLASIGAAHPTLSLDALYRYVYFHMIPGPSTIFEGVQKLDGGHYVRWNGREAKAERYWRPSFQDRPAASERDASAELMQVLRRSVSRSIGTHAAVGAFLSGGLDSSTVAGLAAEARPGLATISMGFDAAGYDEMAYARIASTHFATRPFEYYVTPDDVLRTLPTVAAAFSEPFGNSSAAAAYHCARIGSEQGLELLLAGDGGDELFGGNARYAKQLVFERYARVPRTAPIALLERMLDDVARMTTVFPIGKAQSYVRQAKIPLPDRLQTYNFLHRHEPAQVFSPELLAQADTGFPLRILREEYVVPHTDSAVNRMLFLDWKFTLHDNDLVKVNTMCRLAGIEVAYPMLDQAVVEFSLRVPGNWKVRSGELRWFYKRAMRGFLPQQIIDKTKHGFGLPFGVWTRTHDGLRKLSEDALESLGRRGYFQRQFLAEALRLHREGHASYHGELVWILMVLELWLQAHLPNARIR